MQLKGRNVVISLGVCVCINEPRGEGGLEGYSIGEEYKYEHMSRDKKGNPYYRVYPSIDETYYETTGPNLFKQYFQIKP